MKNLFKLFGMALLISSVMVFSACGDDKESADKPTGLNVKTVGADATFSWSGNGDSYELQISGLEVIKVAGKSYTVEQMANGEYTWKVRAKKGDSFSDWVSGNNFIVSSELLAPYNLAIVRPLASVADFSWSGNGDSYEIELTIKKKGDDSYHHEISILDVKGNHYRFENAEIVGNLYKYYWAVRAKKGSEYSEWVSFENEFYMSDPMPENAKMTVNFGGKIWTAVNIIGEIFKTSAIGDETIFDAFYILGEEVSDGYATVDFKFPISLMTVGETYSLDEFALFSVNYFEATYYDTIQTVPGFFGDWIVYLPEGTVQVTSYDVANSVVSGNVELYNITNTHDLHFSDDPEAFGNPRTKNIKIEFENVKLKRTGTKTKR